MPHTLLDGITKFKTEYFPRYEDHYRRLVAEGQSPRALFIGCSDSRVVSNRLTSSEPGDLFVVRNVGNIIPPYAFDQGNHSVGAAIEYAVEVLHVSDIIVCGHSHCGAIKALYEPPPPGAQHVRQWLQFASDARLPGAVTEHLLRRTEQRSIIIQLDRLMTFPCVESRVKSGDIALHGWHYIIEDGDVLTLDFDSRKFVPLTEGL